MRVEIDIIDLLKILLETGLMNSFTVNKKSVIIRITKK